MVNSWKDALSNGPITRSGHVAIVGRPNVGKSTLLNALLGVHLSPVCNKPQTTWSNIRGILTERGSQIIFVDTPGIHVGQARLFNKMLNENAIATLPNADLILFLVGDSALRAQDERILSLFKDLRKPCLLAINKIDLLRDKRFLLPLIQSFATKFDFDEILPISAKKGDNLDALKTEIRKRLPVTDYHYPEEDISDQSSRFLVSERIREQFIKRLGDELPYSIYIEIDHYQEQPELLSIVAIVWVARSSQRAIVIGRGGAMLKTIGTEARRSIERFIGKKVFLKLWVKDKTGWQNDPHIISSFDATN